MQINTTSFRFQVPLRRCEVYREGGNNNPRRYRAKMKYLTKIQLAATTDGTILDPSSTYCGFVYDSQYTSGAAR